MDENGISGVFLSHTQRMEKSIKQKGILTKGENTAIALETAFSATDTDETKLSADVKSNKGMFLSPQDAEEYRAYKRRKKVEEIMSAIAKSEASLLHGEDPQRVCERAIRLKQAAVKAPPTWLPQAKTYLGGSKVKIDCVIGGNGETLTKVKTYEMRVALRGGAREVTVVVSPSLLMQGKFAEIKRELKKLSRTAKKAVLKVWMHSDYSFATLSKMARVCCETGVKYFCVPYFTGCEKLRFDLTNGCQMEISEVENLSDYRKLCEAGVGRIVTCNVWEIYCEWMKEADQIQNVGVVNLPDTKTKETKKEERKSTEIAEECTGKIEKNLENISSSSTEKETIKQNEKQTETAVVKIEKTATPSVNQTSLDAEKRTGITSPKMGISDLKIL